MMSRMLYKSIPESSSSYANSTEEPPMTEDDRAGLLTTGPHYEYRRWFGIRRSTVLLCMYVLGYTAFLLIGGFLMSLLETPYEEQLKLQTRLIKEEFLYRHPKINKSEFEHVLKAVVHSTQRGINVLDSQMEETSWTWGQSFLFTVTVVTTVGYGHIAPLTPAGKFFCILYAALGIPFTLVFLSACVQRLLSPTFRVLSWLLSGKLGELMSPLGVRLVHLTMLCCIFGSCFVIIPTVAFACLEPSWAFLDSFYFVCISLTTIGLGDYIPGDEEGQQFKELYKASVAVYLLLGLVFLTLTLTVYYEIPQLNLGLKLHRHMDIRVARDTNLHGNGSIDREPSENRKDPEVPDSSGTGSMKSGQQVPLVKGSPRHNPFTTSNNIK